MRQQHTLQPKLRFPEFYGDWVNFSFKEIFNFTTGKNIKQKEAAPHFETPCVRYGELYYMYKEVISKVINYTNLDKSELKFSEGDEILLPSAGEDPMDIGSASALTLKDVAIGRTINILKPKSKDVYSSIFASYYINQKLKVKISSLAKGVSISNVYNTDLQTLFIKLPTLNEQQKIADYLSTIDTKINLLEEKREQLTRYKKAMMQKLFSQEIRFKPTERHTELVEVELVEVYPDWEEKRLGDVFTGLKGQGLSKDSLSDGGKNNCILYGELFTKYNEVIKSVISQTDVLGNISSKGGDVLIPASTTTNAFDLANATALLLDNVILGGDINILRPKQKVSSEFYAYYLSNFKKRELGKLGQGITIVHLYYTHFKNIMIDIPSLPEQQKIADFLSAIDESIEKVNEQITQTQSFKKAMLQQMFV